MSNEVFRLSSSQRENAQSWNIYSQIIDIDLSQAPDLVQLPPNQDGQTFIDEAKQSKSRFSILGSRFLGISFSRNEESEYLYSLRNNEILITFHPKHEYRSRCTVKAYFSQGDYADFKSGKDVELRLTYEGIEEFKKSCIKQSINVKEDPIFDGISKNYNQKFRKFRKKLKNRLFPISITTPEVDFEIYPLSAQFQEDYSQLRFVISDEFVSILHVPAQLELEFHLINIDSTEHRKVE